MSVETAFNFEDEDPVGKDMELRGELAALLNRYSRENRSNTPDFILAGYMMVSLKAFEEASRKREEWYGVPLHIGMEKP
jgi:hypothetical protein